MILVVLIMLISWFPSVTLAETETEPVDEEPAPQESMWDCVETWADESRTFGKDSFHAEYQWDTREFNTFHAMGSARLPAGLNLWGFVDFESTQNASGSRADTSKFFYEIDLRKNVWNGLGVVAEVNDFPGTDNVLVRAGLFYMPRFDFLKEHSLFVLIKGFAYESDLDGGQISFALNKAFPNILGGRVSMGGFLDVNFDSGAMDDEVNILTEWQLRVRVVGDLHALAEVRLNEFLSNDQNLGVGLGLRYNF